MSPAKRKAIVFDLEGGSKNKIPRKTENRGHPNVVIARDSQIEEAHSNWISYMQPEILTIPFMIELLEQCNIGSSILAGKSKEELQKLFLKHVTPKPQRHYRPNRLGKILAQMQQKFSSSQTPDWHKMVAPPKDSQQKPRSNLASLIPQSPATDRLKPPVQSLINSERKTIQLGGSSKTQSNLPNSLSKNSSLDNIDSLLKRQPKKTETQEAEAKTVTGCKRLITLNVTSDKTAKKLKTDTGGSTKDNEKNDQNSSVSSTPSPSKRPSVSWP